MNSYNVTKLNNGIRIVTENIPYVKSFSLGFWFDAGSKNEHKHNNGISHFIEHMLFKGTKKRSARRIADEIESLGGYLNAFTSKEHTCFYGRGLSQHLPKTFEILSDMIQNSLFKSRDIANEAGVIIDELHDIEDSPEELIFDKFETNIFDGHPLGLPIIGTVENISSFDRSKFLDYMKQHYANNNLYIVASGDVNHEKIIALTEKYFKNDHGSKNHNLRKFQPNSAANIVVEKETQQTHIIYGRPTFGFNNEKRLAVSVLSHIFGEGSSSRLFQALRERNGITYQVNSFLNSFQSVSTFGIYFSTNPKNFSKAFSIVLRELEKMTNKPFSLKELNRAKEYIKANILMSLESTTNRMLRMAQSMIYFKRVKSVEETISEIDKLDINHLYKISRELFNQEKFTKTIITGNPKILRSAA